MTYQNVRRSGMVWPLKPASWYNNTQTVLDAANETIAMIGRVVWADGGSHTLDTSGSSKIYLHTGSTAVFDDATAVMHIGIQDVDATTGQPGRPDGTYDVNAVLTPAADTSPALTTVSSLVAATPTTGTKTMAHGDLIAVTAKLITVGSSPASQVSFLRGPAADLSGADSGSVFASTNISGSFVSSSLAPCVLLIAADGTYGTLEGITFIGQATGQNFSDSSNPDEYGNIFQVPFDCKVTGFAFNGGLAGNTSDFQYDLYSDPLGTPASMLGGAVAVAAESCASGAANMGFGFPFASAISLSKNTNYCIAVKATGAGNVTIYGQTLPAAGARALFPGGTTTQGATRNNGSGAFTGSTTIIRAIGVRIGEIDIPAGGGASFSPIGAF